MTNQLNSKDLRATSLVAFCAMLLVAMLVTRFASDFKASILLNEVGNWLQSTPLVQSWVDGLRRYGAYAVGNVELITLFFLIISPLRRIGARLAILLALVTLAVALAVTLKSSGWLAQAGALKLGISLGLVSLLGLGSFILLRLSRPDKLAQEPAQEWKQALEKELADETMAAEPIANYTELAERVPFHSDATDQVEESFNQLLLDVTRELRDVIEGEHRAAFIEAQKQLDILPDQQKYFPRQPMIIPKLIRAVNSEDSTKKKLVDVISQDPVIAGELLRFASIGLRRIGRQHRL